MNHAPIHRFTVLACAAVLASPAHLAAQSAIPDVMTYQGYVTDNNNVALANATPENHIVRFRIYGSPTGNDVVWAEQQTVTIFQGNFSVLLGGGQPVGNDPKPALEDVFSSEMRYLGITVGTNPEFTPRQRLLPNAYAFRAKVAESVGGVLSLTGNDVTLTNGFTANSASTVNGLLSVNDLSVDNGLIEVRPGNNTVTIGGTLDLNGALDVRDATTLNSLAVTGASTLNTLGVSGASTLNTLGVSGASTLNTLGVSGASNLNTLAVSGASTLNTLGVTGAANLNGALAVSGTTTMNTLGVSGASTLSSLSVSGATSLNTLGVSGTATLNGFTSTANSAITGSDNNGVTAALRVSSAGKTMLIGGSEIDGLNGWLELNKNNANSVVIGGSVPEDTFALRIRGAGRTLVEVYNRSDTSDDATLNVTGRAYKSRGGTSWDSASDRRLKTDIRPYHAGLAEIIQLEPVRFHYKDNKELGLTANDENIGFIAQDVRKIIPEAVSGNPDTEDYLRLHVDPIHWAAINAIKELDAKLTAQQSEAAELKQANAALEARLAKLEALLTKGATASN